MNIVALICARGNSKGIKNKNLLKYKNTTLLGQAIKQSLKSKLINRVIISTDSKKIAKEAEFLMNNHENLHNIKDNLLQQRGGNGAVKKLAYIIFDSIKKLS